MDDNSHIFIVTTGLTGMLHASFELVSRLETEGYQVTYACPQDVRERVQVQGFTYLQLPPINLNPTPPIPDFQYKWQRVFYRFFNFRRLQKAAIQQLGMDKFSAILRELKPDEVLLDMELHEHIITAVSMGFRVTLLSQWFSVWEREGLPPPWSDLLPDECDDVKKIWQKEQKKRRWRSWKQRLLSGFMDRRSVLRAYAKTVNFPLQELVSYQWPEPFGYRTLPVWSMTHWALEFPHKPRPNLHYIGGMVYAERRDIHTESTINQQLKNIFNQKKQAGHRLIYCSVSTMKKVDSTFVQRIIEAVGEREDWILIVGMGGQSTKNFNMPMPSNVHIFDWIPQLEVLEHADCSINHGGIHTINECIYFRVPMLVYSGEQHDQNGCAARVAYHGIGIRGDKNEDDTKTIQQHIERVLTDTSFKRKINDIYQQYQANKTNSILPK